MTEGPDDLTSVASGDFHRNDRLSRALLIVAIGAFVVVLVMVGVLLFRPATSSYNPLGDYPKQQTTKLTFHLDEKIGVIARKCAKSDGVMVRGDRTWIPLDAPGVIVNEVGGVEATRYKSCGPNPRMDHFAFANAIPVAVAAIVKSAGLHNWRISGTETPIDQNGREGVPRTWTTNEFEILP